LEDAGDKATEEEKTAINGAIEALEGVLKEDDKEAIETKTAALTEAVSALAQKMYAEAAQQAEGQEGEQAQAEPADDAVDAEFEEVKDDDKK